MGGAGGEPTLLFTDIVGSTPLWERHGEAMHAALAVHDTILRGAASEHGGEVVKTVGDGFMIRFAEPRAAIAAALAAQQRLAAANWGEVGPLLVRAALHRGPVFQRDDDLFGPTVNRCARLRDCAHGGQVLLTEAVLSAVAGHLPAGCEVIELGWHQLRGLELPIRILQLCHHDLRERFPPLRQLATFANNLPAEPTPLIGRERELAELPELVAAQRLVSLCGPGGCGKTRLAQAVAAEALDRFPDGAWFVDLAPTRRPDDVIAAVAEVLAVREQPGSSPAAAVRERLHESRLLLVLDNCEHQIAACAELAADCLRHTPKVHLLATSIQPLEVAGELVQRLEGLPTPPREMPPEPERLLDVPSVRLLVERAQAAEPSFALNASNAAAVAAIAAGLDGLPLALELAAPLTRVLSPTEIAARLNARFLLLRTGRRAGPARQQSLETAVRWGYELLSPPAQRLLTELSVFAGPFDLEAVQGVCRAERGPFEILALLDELVRSSFVVGADAGGARVYRLMETLRLFARERLAESGDEPLLRARHATWFSDLAERLAPHLRGEQEPAAMAMLTRALDDLRATLTWELAQPNGGRALADATALWRFWYLRGHLTEGLSWLHRALAATQSAPDELRARAWTGAGNLATALGRWDEAEGYHRAALETRRGLGDTAGVSASLTNLGYAASRRGDLESAAQIQDEAIEVARASGDTARLATALVNRSQVAMEARHTGLVRSLLEEALPLLRQGSNAVLTAAALHNLGSALLEDGEHDAGLECLAESLRLHRDAQNEAGMASGLCAVANALTGWRPPGEVVSLFAAAEALEARLESGAWPSRQQPYQRALAELSDRLGPQAFQAARDEGAALELTAAVSLALDAARSRPGSRERGPR